LAGALLLAAGPAMAAESDPPRPPGMRPLGVTVQEDGTVPFSTAMDRDLDRGWPNWWMFRLEGLRPGQPLQLNGNRQSARLPVVSEDGGRTWRHFEIIKPVTVSGTEAIFAWYVPYLLANAEAFAARQPELGDRLRVRELCRSEQGRPVHLFEIGAPLAEGKPVLWIQARQHAWEVGGSWTAQGLMDWAVGESPEAARLRAAATLIVVPLMDVDQVQLGNGGKGQKPHDHNRDWSDKPIYASVRAAQTELRALAQRERLALFFDLHDPGYYGDKKAGRYGISWWLASLTDLPPAVRARVEKLSELFKAHCKASYTFSGFNEIGDKYGGGVTAGAWVKRLAGARIAGGTLEIPVGPPSNFTQAPRAQHLILGAEIGQSFVGWMNEEQ
jgi:hypothetical protein